MINRGCVWGVTDNDPFRSLPLIAFKKQVLRERGGREDDSPLQGEALVCICKDRSKILSGKISFCPAAPHMDTHRLTQLRFSSLTRWEADMEICPAVPTQPGSLSMGGG